MVHGIVERHSGFLTIDSTPGQGTTVTMRIPLAQEDNGVRTDPSTLRHMARSLNVLVVDDDENSRTLLSEYLALDGHRVTTAKDTIGGIAAFDNGEFDLVITDRAMPKISGDELARHVKASNRQVPVLMIKGFAQVMASKSENPEGVNHIMGKPFTLKELRNEIQRLFILDSPEVVHSRQTGS